MSTKTLEKNRKIKEINCYTVGILKLDTAS